MDDNGEQQVISALSGAAEASGPASHSSEGHGAANSFGGQVSPRAARSQISTAVSFEGVARAAGSAALPSRSLEEESALSAAEADGFGASCPPAQQAADAAMGAAISSAGGASRAGGLTSEEGEAEADIPLGVAEGHSTGGATAGPAALAGALFDEHQGSQGEALGVADAEGWQDDDEDEFQGGGAANSRDGEARGWAACLLLTYPWPTTTTITTTTTTRATITTMVTVMGMGTIIMRLQVKDRTRVWQLLPLKARG
eukprot:gene11267-11417_t